MLVMRRLSVVLTRYHDQHTTISTNEVSYVSL